MSWLALPSVQTTVNFNVENVFPNASHSPCLYFSDWLMSSRWGFKHVLWLFSLLSLVCWMLLQSVWPHVLQWLLQPLWNRALRVCTVEFPASIIPSNKHLCFSFRLYLSLLLKRKTHWLAKQQNSPLVSAIGWLSCLLIHLHTLPVEHWSAWWW